MTPELRSALRERRLLTRRAELDEERATIDSELHALRYGPGERPPEPPEKLSGVGRVSKRLRDLSATVGRDMRNFHTLLSRFIERTDERFARAEDRLDTLDRRATNMHERVRDVEQRVGTHLNRDSDLDRLAKAVSTRAEMLDNTSADLARLEKAVGAHLERLKTLEQTVRFFDKWLGTKGIDTSLIQAIVDRLDGVDSKLAALHPNRRNRSGSNL